MATTTLTTATKIAVPNGTDHVPAQLPPYSPPRAPSKPKLAEKVGSKLRDKPLVVGDFEWGPWTIHDVLIPPNTGRGMVKKYHQRRTLYQYTAMSALGLYMFHKLSNPAYQAAALCLLFPGAGFTAVPSLASFVAFLITMILVPISLFVWFMMGGIVFPFGLWIASAAGAGYLAVDKPILDKAGSVWAVLCFASLAWVMNYASRLNAAGFTKAQERNKYLIPAVVEQMTEAVPAPSPGSREVDPETLRHIQWILERGLSPKNDFSYHDIIDQFRESAIRYQLYSAVDALSLYQCHYVPGFHGYVSKASQNCIEKSLQKRVMKYWKWESIFGKLKFSDWDPIKKDNIMVTGYLASAMGLYQQSTGDRRYQEKNCLEFVVDDGKHYKTDYEGLADALNNNMEENPYCLYPCEPNWTYSLCNLTGMAGLTISDRILGRDLGLKMRSRFERCLEEEFTECDGRILPLRSEFTGLTIPNFCGVLSDCINTMLLTAYLPHIAHRNWAMIRKENISHNEKGELEVLNLRGVDLMDPCNYRFGEGPVRVFLAGAAAEFGDEKVRREAIEQLDTRFFPVERTPTGAVRNVGLSASLQAITLMARLIRHRDLANATLNGPSENALQGPLLEECPFPEVLVAKAYSDDGKQLDLVLYNGREPGVFKLGFQRLVAGKAYSVSTGESVTADDGGKAVVEVKVDGRTQILLKPVM